MCEICNATAMMLNTAIITAGLDDSCVAIKGADGGVEVYYKDMSTTPKLMAAVASAISILSMNGKGAPDIALMHERN